MGRAAGEGNKTSIRAEPNTLVILSEAKDLLLSHAVEDCATPKAGPSAAPQDD